VSGDALFGVIAAGFALLAALVFCKSVDRLAEVVQEAKREPEDPSEWWKRGKRGTDDE
jgi:hypothetical protein